MDPTRREMLYGARGHLSDLSAKMNRLTEEKSTWQNRYDKLCKEIEGARAFYESIGGDHVKAMSGQKEDWENE